MSNININDVNAFLGIMDNWIKHPLFQKISRVRHERHWAKNLNLKENNYSDILRWLLDTDEGHGLGDYFLKKFIVSVMNKSGENILNEWFSFIEINLFRLNSIVVREVIIKNNENGFIDILVVDNYNKFVIVIERKDGSCIRDGQLDKYHTWLKENYIKYGYKYLCVVSDGNNKMKESGDEKWLLIDDEWLVDAFDEVINKGICSSFVEQQLIDLANVFDWSEDRDAYFCGIEDEISEFSRVFFKDIKVLRGLKPFGLGLNSKHDRKAAYEVIPKTVESQDAHKINQAIHLLIKHHYLMDWVFDSDYFSSIKYEVNQTRKWRNSFVFHNVSSKNGNYILQLTHEKIRYSDEYWSFWINIEIDTKYEEAHKFYERICMCINYRKERLFWDEVTNEKIKDYMEKKYSLPQKGKTIARNNSLDITASAQEVVNAITPWLETLQEIADIISSKEG